MPTLTNYPPDSEKDATDSGDDDGSVTILQDDSTTNDGMVEPSPVLWQRNDKSVTFDDSTILCSTSKIERPYSVRRRKSLNSDVSLRLSFDDCRHKKLEENVAGESQMNTTALISSNKSPHLDVWKQHRDTRDQPWPNRDEYNEKYHHYVISSIATFKAKYPGSLRDYRSMTSEAKSREQQRVLALLTRLGISKKVKNKYWLSGTTEEENESQLDATTDGRGPKYSDRRKLLDETLSPSFSLNEHKDESTIRLREGATLKESSNKHDTSITERERSEVLLSMDDSEMEEEKVISDGLITLPSTGCQRNHLADSVEFPFDNDPNDESSIELARREPGERNYSDGELSYETPEDQLVSRSSYKRLASVSGKRGSDSQRMRPNDYGNNIDTDISSRFGRLSLSPLANSPQEKLFAASQSPISPRLTYHIRDDQHMEENGSLEGTAGQRISWGLDIGYDCRSSEATPDSVVTNTPPMRYRNEKERYRTFREVPVNVSLKDGATFHIDKLAVKRTEQAFSRSTNVFKSHTTVVRSRRLVNFPDPFVCYGSRQRRVLKEVYSWIRRVESEYEGYSAVPAAGVFFSLSEQQIIDLSLKLVSLDLSAKRDVNSQQEPSSCLKGNTLVVVRSKEETTTWECMLREKTGCSVSNHSLLPLSERIRPSSAEKACAHDVVLTTYDAIKSPDVTIPVTEQGYSVLTKIGNDKSWHSTRMSSHSQHDSSTKLTKKLSILHRIHFRRIIFVDAVGRKCFLAKGGTARALAAIALNGDSRIVFFRESESDGSDPLKALRKCDKRAFQSVCSVLRLREDHNLEPSDDDDEDDSIVHNTLEDIAINVKDLC